MKAMVQTAYGTPEVLQLQDVPQPAPGDGEVLIRVRAASLGPADSAFRKGEPFLVRLMYGLRKPRKPIGGTEFSGDVVEVAPGVHEFKPGDAVVGMSADNFGAHAEYLALPAHKTLIRKPAAVSYETATAMMDGPPTSLTFLRDVAHLKPGQRVLINGASGAVGSAAVQLAKHFEAEVTGVCSGRNVELVRELGADHVIDYTETDFTQTGQQWDVIFDAVATRSFAECKDALTENGVYMTTGIGLGIVWDILRTLPGRKKAKFTTAGLKQNKENAAFLAGLVEFGELKPLIDRTYPLEAIPEAFEYVDSGRKKGSVIIQVAA
jgi:NADPH:quinone reductase-like Zn-dependent oxidoreductase